MGIAKINIINKANYDFLKYFLSIFNITFTIEYHTYGLVGLKLYSKENENFQFFWYKVWHQLLFKLYAGLWKNKKIYNWANLHLNSEYLG